MSRAVVVAIPALNEVLNIRRVLDELDRNLPDDIAVTFAVIDGGSTDGTQSCVQDIARTRSNVVLMNNPARIQSAALNMVVRLWEPPMDVLVRCDAHATYPAGFVRMLLATLDRTGADAVVVPMDSIGDTCLQKAIAWVSDSLVGSGGSAHRGGRRSGYVDHGHHAAFRRESFCRAGGYDEGFTHNEDAELDCRQRGMGSRIYLDADNRIAYHPRDSLTTLWRQYANYGRGRSRTIRRHPDSWRLRQCLVPLNFLGCITALLIAATVMPLVALWPLLYLAALCANAAMLALRHRSLCALWAAPAACVMHSAWSVGFLDGLLRIKESRWNPLQQKPLDTSIKHDSGASVLAPLRALLVDPSLFTAPYDAALTEGLQQSGVQVRWATRPVRPGDRSELPEELADAFFYRRTDRLDALPSSVRVTLKGCSHILGLFRLVRRVSRTRPDVVHFQWTVLPPLDAIAIWAIRHTCPVVLTVHDTVPFNGERLSWFQNLAFFLPMKLADRVIVHTRAGRTTLQRAGLPVDKISVIQHGPLKLSEPIPDVPHGARWTFVMFGEIKPYKGLDVVIEALALLPAELRERMHIIVAGRPRMDMQPVIQRLDELGLNDCVELRLKRLAEDEMATLFAQTDTFLLPYRQIDASGVYYLVKSLGRWLIASKVGAFAEELQDGIDGALCPAGDIQAVAAAMADAVTYRRRGVPRESGKDWATIGEQTRQCYEDAAVAARVMPGDDKAILAQSRQGRPS